MSERELLPSDVPGTFLNIALYSFCSVNPLLRLASYNLICAMKEAFHLQITGHILEAHSMFMDHHHFQAFAYHPTHHHSHHHHSHCHHSHCHHSYSLTCTDLCLSELDINYVKTVSADIACNEPQMSLEFLTEAIGSFQKADLQQKLFCLSYMSPWLLNLGRCGWLFCLVQ